MNSESVKDLAGVLGADVVGVADLALLKGIQTQPPDLLGGHTRAISIGVRLSDAVVDSVVDTPTPLYHQHQLRANALLDEIAFRMVQHMRVADFKACPIPASHILDRVRWRSYISHKAVAIAAGIGWQGKSLLVVNPRYGPRIRLVTILTDLPLEADKPITNRCGSCSLCAEACPAQAIKNVSTTLRYTSRDEALFFDRCVDKVTREFPELRSIEGPTCGVCVRVCPWGQHK